MRSWPLKQKFGAYAAVLTMVALVASLLSVRPLVYRYQVRELDRELEENAREIIRDITNFSNAPADYIRKPIEERFIPEALRRRYYQIIGPEGQTLRKSANLGKNDLSRLPLGSQTIQIADRNCRIGSFAHGYLTIHLGTRLGTIEEMQNDLMKSMIFIIPLAGVFVFLGGWLLGVRALRPVSVLSAAAQKICTSQPEERLPLPASKDEIYQLTEVLNASFERLQKSYRAAARFSADASHQLKTPITILRAGLDSLGKSASLTVDEQAEVAELRKQTRRLSTLVEDLLLLAQIDAGRLKVEPSNINLAECVLAAADDVAALCQSKNLTLETDIPPTLDAMADAKRVNIILQNLTENAVKYTPAHGHLWIKAGSDTQGPWVRIANSGSPISPSIQEHLFERFYRGDVGENIKGHGLGLNIARSLAEAQGGSLTLFRTDETGTEFELRLVKCSMSVPPRPQ